MADASKPAARWKIVTLPGEMLKSKGWQKLNSLAMDRSVIVINGRLQDMARVQTNGTCKNIVLAASYHQEIIRPKDLFLTMVNTTILEAKSCI